MSHVHRAAAPGTEVIFSLELFKRRGRRGILAYGLRRRKPAPDPFGDLVARVESAGGPITTAEMDEIKAGYRRA